MSILLTGGLIGEDPNGIPNNLMPYISRVASGKLEYFSCQTSYNFEMKNKK